MGDGPAYDAMYARNARHAARKKATQKERADMLHGILMKVGFGENDGELCRLEGEAAHHLWMAYDLLRQLAR
jgi:hypothetical protein